MSGFYEGTDLVDKVFHGFRLDPDTGNLTVEILDGDTPVTLPQDDIIDKYDYKQWLWTKDTIQFEWGSKGHLLMRML
jgi:hypothetical protein